MALEMRKKPLSNRCAKPWPVGRGCRGAGGPLFFLGRRRGLSHAFYGVDCRSRYQSGVPLLSGAPSPPPPGRSRRPGRRRLSSGNGAHVARAPRGAVVPGPWPWALQKVFSAKRGAPRGVKAK